MTIDHDPGLIEASDVNLEIIERLLLEHGFEAEIDSTWILVKMPKWSLFINHADYLPAIDMAGAIRLREDVNLEETLRFVNQLNNRIAAVGFSLWEPIDEAMANRGLIDLGDLWASIALPIGSGFSAYQFVAALDLLCNGLEDAHAAAVATGLVDPEESASHQKEAFCHGL